MQVKDTEIHTIQYLEVRKLPILAMIGGLDSSVTQHHLRSQLTILVQEAGIIILQVQFPLFRYG